MTSAHSTTGNYRERFKVAAIPVLLIVLVAVVAWRMKGANSEQPVESIQLVHPTSTRAEHPAALRPKWPTTTLEEVISLNPFDPLPSSPREPGQQPAAMNEEASAQPSEAVAPILENSQAEIRIGNLQAVYRDAHGLAAILDSRVVRVGDVTSDGGRIVAITEHGITVEPK